MRKFRAVFLLSALFLCIPLAFADEVTLKEGGIIKGDIVSRNDELVVLKTDYGTVTFQVADIASVNHATLLEKTILSDLEAIAPSDISSRLKLADRAVAAGLGTLAKRVYSQVIAIDPNDKAARKALGYMMFEGEWVTPREKDLHKGLVPYKGRWVARDEREELIEGDVERQYFAEYGLTPAEGRRMLESVNDIDVSIEPRGGYMVKMHVGTIPVKDKPYFYSVDALNWKRLGVFVGVTVFDQGRRRTTGFGTLDIKIHEVSTDALGSHKPGKELHSETVLVTPDMWDKKSDFKYWDAKINPSTYEKLADDTLRKSWFEEYYMNNDGILFVLANRDVNLLTPPGVYYVEAVFTLKDMVRKAAKYVQYHEPR